MIARVLSFAAMLLLSLSLAHAAGKREPAPLTDTERATVLERLDGYSGEDRDYIFGRLDGSIAPETAGGGKSYDDNAAILAFGAATDRGRHLERVIVELGYVIAYPCPEGQIRIERQCQWDRGFAKPYTELFHNHYYRGCTEGRSFGRCDD